jgi:hypothetical protein
MEGRAFPNKPRRLRAGGGGGNEMLAFQRYFDISHNWESRAVSRRRRPHYALKEIPGYSGLLEAEWAPGLLKADRRHTTLPGIEPAASHLVAQYLKNNCATTSSKMCHR